MDSQKGHSPPPPDVQEQHLEKEQGTPPHPSFLPVTQLDYHENDWYALQPVLKRELLVAARWVSILLEVTGYDK